MFYRSNSDFIQLEHFLKSVEEESIRHKVLIVEYLSIILNVISFFITGGLAIDDNSITALAVAIDSLLDILATVAVIWRFKRAESDLNDSKKRNKTALVFISILFFISAFLIEVESVKTLLFKERPIVSLNFIVLSLIQSAVFSFVSIYKFSLAQKLIYTSNATLISDGINSLITSLCSLSMAISMSLFMIDKNIWYFDGLFGFVIGICILFYGCHLLFSIIFFRR